MTEVLILQPGDFVHTLGDAHVYNDHIEPLLKQVRVFGGKPISLHYESLM